MTISNWIANFCFKIQSYSHYYWHSQSNHYLHSPFVFELYQFILKHPNNHSAWQDHVSAQKLIIIPDIRKNEQKYREWMQLVLSEQYNYTIDFGHYGLLITVDNGSPKQHFTLK